MASFNASALFSQDEWEIWVEIGTFARREDAQRALNTVSGTLEAVEEDEGRPVLRLSFVGELDEESYLLTDDCITIREMTDDAKARLGPPIDTREPGAIEKILETLNEESGYILDDKDYKPSSLTLGGLLARHGEGYPLETIAEELKEKAVDAS